MAQCILYGRKKPTTFQTFLCGTLARDYVFQQMPSTVRRVSVDQCFAEGLGELLPQCAQMLCGEWNPYSGLLLYQYG